MHTIELDLANAQWSYSKAPLATTAASPHKPSRNERDTFNFGDLTHITTWRPCSQFPSQIHAELIRTGEIPDPFQGRNEQRVQWVGEEDWIYRGSFRINPSRSMGQQTDVIFEGLDTFATVFLNGRKILEADNMFARYRVRITNDLHDDNILYIVFRSAFRRGRRLEQEHLGRGKHCPAWNGDPSRLFVRKAAYHYGWDWGLTIMTAGPWKPIRLETYTSRICDFWPRAKLDEKLQASLQLSFKVTNASSSHSLNVAVHDPEGAVVSKTSLNPLSREVTINHFDKGDTKLWYPCGLGRQHLYSVRLSLIDMETGAVVHSIKRKIGFRRIEIVQEPLLESAGTSFCFRVNSIPLFVGGSNWIPIDSILSNATEERYRAWLELLVAGNQQMIRVWGGGVYEENIFYDLCDELGILVWQDFPFACGAYPTHPSFLDSVQQEAVSNVKRLRCHPSLALFCGNNEDYQLAESEKLDYDPHDRDGDWSKTNFPARELYERLLPSIVAAYSDVFYWPGSPFGGSSTRDETVGDIHQWDVWHGSQAPYQDYDQLSGRFVSEFGMQAAPAMRTIEYYLNGEACEAFSQSRTMDAHNKAGGHARRLASYIADNIRNDASLEGYVYSTQFIQAEALSSAFSAWRRLFKGDVQRAYCSGALVWQLNDVWPCTSWSIADYFMRPKPSYYAIKRALAPIALGSKRYTERYNADPYSAINFIEKVYVDIWSCSSRQEQTDANLVVEAFDISTGQRVFRMTKGVHVRSNCSTELHRVEMPTHEAGDPGEIVVEAQLVDDEGKTLARIVDWPQPFKHVKFADSSSTELRVTLSISEGEVTLQALRPVKGLVMTVNDDSKLSDNFIDLIPGKKVVLQIDGATHDTELSWAHCDTFRT